MSEDRGFDLVGVTEAAAILGVWPSNFVRDWATRPDFPRPAALLAGGRLWHRQAVDAYRRRLPRRRGERVGHLHLSEEAAAWLPEIKRRIVRGFHPRRIVLFGSQARGTAQRGSDIDLLVVMDAVEGRRQLAASMYAALSGIPVGTDIVVATTADLDRFRGVPGTILGPALEEGRSLYVAA